MITFLYTIDHQLHKANAYTIPICLNFLPVPTTIFIQECIVVLSIRTAIVQLHNHDKIIQMKGPLYFLSLKKTSDDINTPSQNIIIYKLNTLEMIPCQVGLSSECMAAEAWSSYLLKRSQYDGVDHTYSHLSRLVI